jgi:hypothetical protein
MFNFGVELRETEKFPVGIVNNVTITKAFFVKSEKYEALDIVFNKDENGILFEHRQRLFSVSKDNIPSWSSYEKEVSKLKQQIFHILSRFYSFDELKFEADTFEQMAVRVIEFLEERPIADQTPFDLKFIFNKSFEYPEIPSTGRFMKTEKDLYELSYSEWEKENRLLHTDEDSDDAEDNGGFTL